MTTAAKPNTLARFLVRPVAWSCLLGVTAFLGGFFFPFLFDSDSNLLPVVGFILGSISLLVALVVGLIIGLGLSLLKASPRTHVFAMAAAVVATLVATFFYAIPEPRLVGTVVDAVVVGCHPASNHDESQRDLWLGLLQAQDRLPPPNWEAEMADKIAHPDGVVLELDVQHEWKILASRIPWEHGELEAVESVDPADSGPRLAYTRSSGSDCAAYATGQTERFELTWEADATSPPVTLPAYLRQRVATPLSSDYEQLFPRP